MSVAFTADWTAIEQCGLKALVFHGPEEAWFDFVMDNRHTAGFSHDYDSVMGPVANDNVYETLTLFEDGIITKAEAIARLKTNKLVDQVLLLRRVGPDKGGYWVAKCLFFKFDHCQWSETPRSLAPVIEGVRRELANGLKERAKKKGRS